MSTYADESSRQHAFAVQLREEAAQADARARAFALGDKGETSVRGILAQLEPDGWSALHRRRWPGTKQADLDHVMVGPGGLVVLDSKNWRGSLRFSKGRLYRDQADETDSVVGIVAQVDAVTEVVRGVGLPPAAITGALVLTFRTSR